MVLFKIINTGWWKMTVLMFNFDDDGNDWVFKQHITGGTFGKWGTLWDGRSPPARIGELKELISCFRGISMSMKGSHRQIRMLWIMGRRTPSQVLQSMLVEEPDLMLICLSTICLWTQRCAVLLSKGRLWVGSMASPTPHLWYPASYHSPYHPDDGKSDPWLSFLTRKAW